MEGCGGLSLTTKTRFCRANQGEVKYEYDGDGFLVTRTCRGEPTVFIPDPLSDEWHPLVELLPSGRQRFYLWDDRTPLAVVENGAATFFLHDHIGSVRCVADPSGKVIERRDYSAFGVFEGLRADSGLVPGFAGLFWDSAASVYLPRARAYSPDLGRFLQMDPQHRVPFGSQKDLSPYVYCGNDPVNYADTTGLTPECIDDEDDKRRGPGGPHGDDGGGEGDDDGGDSTERPANDPVPDDRGSRPADPDSGGSPRFGLDTPRPDTTPGGGGTDATPRGVGRGHDRTDPAPGSAWSRFTSLFHSAIQDTRAPAEPVKKFDPNLAAYVIKEVTDNVNRYAKARFGSESGLSEVEIQEARRCGLQQFFADHAVYPGYRGPKSDLIVNRLTPSGYGTVDLDWFTTLGHHSSRWSNIPLSRLYVPGKLKWFWDRTRETRTPLPDLKSFAVLAMQGLWPAAFDALFPLSGWNAAKLGDELLSGSISIQDAMTQGGPTATRGRVSTRPNLPARDITPKQKRRRQTSLKPWDNYPPYWFPFPKWLWNLIGRDDQHGPGRMGMPMPLDPDDRPSGGGTVAPFRLPPSAASF